MITYRFNDTAETVTVASPEELVTFMNKTAKFPSDSPRQYMLDYALRSVQMRNVDIRATDFEAFVEDLIRSGDISDLSNL